VLRQIDDVLTVYDEIRRKSAYDDCSDLGRQTLTEVAARLSSTLARLAPPGSQYQKMLADLNKMNPGGSPYGFLGTVPGLLRALRAEYAVGSLRSLEELIHGDLFADFLEMADHLLSEGYKDPAAVLAGGVLEEHLRQLCTKHGVAIAQAGQPKKADTMNGELAAIKAYSKLDQKSITAWLDLRNKAAHGHYSEYDPQQVKLMIQGVRDFASRVPA
jgi:hypothetical protein